ncbi:hypothetical protein FRB98_003304 [Tulasnella sp. 332]|nr:hypothetical protein FRB98_003304 [Tulasnella sp. 332]
MNPIENEAVVAAALNASADQFTLPDTAHMLPDLKRRPGLTMWYPAVNSTLRQPQPLPTRSTERAPSQDEDAPSAAVVSLEKDRSSSHVDHLGVTAFACASYDDYVKNSTDADMKNGKLKMQPTQWPPENAHQLGLENCFRIYPHLQNTGGFFIAVLQKKEDSRNEDVSMEDPIDGNTSTQWKRPASTPDNNENPSKRHKVEEAPATTSTPTSSATDRPTKTKTKKNPPPTNKDDQVATEGTVGTFKENPFTFINGNDPTLRKNLLKLHLNSGFPANNVFVRHQRTDPMKTFHLANDMVKRIITSNAYDRMRLISAGVKAFSRHDAGSSSASDEVDMPEDVENHVAPETLAHLSSGGASLNFAAGRESALRFVSDGMASVYDFVEDGAPSDTGSES